MEDERELGDRNEIEYPRGKTEVSDRYKQTMLRAAVIKLLKHTTEPVYIAHFDVNDSMFYQIQLVKELIDDGRNGTFEAMRIVIVKNPEVIL